MPCDRDTPDTFFECVQCGDCCKGFGGTYVSETDLAAIAAYLNMSAAELRRRCCVASGDKIVLGQRPDGFCLFWDRNCTIHPVKPLMCRRWPFIPSVLNDPSNWRIMAGSCPGIKPDADPDALLAYIKSYLAIREHPSFKGFQNSF